MAIFYVANSKRLPEGIELESSYQGLKFFHSAWWCNVTILKNHGVRQWEG